MTEKELSRAVKHLSESDKIMSTIIKKFGKCNLHSNSNYFNSLLEAIIGQQLSMKAADAIIKKFKHRFGENIHPEKILNASQEELKASGISPQKIKYIKDLSIKYLGNDLNFDNIKKKSDEKIIADLTKVKGIGVWTAHMFLIFTLGRPDILPYGDLGIKKAIMLNYGFKILPTEQTVIEVSEQNNWKPYNSVASLYLWKSLDNE
jgi:DNA-3-methyladenine glycosylase II